MLHLLSVFFIIHLVQRSTILVRSVMLSFSLHCPSGSGLNHALLTAQLAPALTKSYQEKMRQWENMQRSHFLGKINWYFFSWWSIQQTVDLSVNYRRQSITPKNDSTYESRKTSIVTVINSPTTDLNLAPTTDETSPDTIDEIKDPILIKPRLPLSPILSPHQRSLILHQWREIMSEEVSLRHYHHYLEKQQLLFEELERNLKMLKSNIFCTHHRQYSFRTQSCSQLDHLEHHSSDFQARSRSLQSLNAMPASWVLAVQSAAYSDILDGTSGKTSKRAVLFNKAFFDQLEHFKQDRRKFQDDFVRHLQAFNHST